MAITRRSSRSAVCASRTRAKAKVGLQAALVEFVEDHAADAVERRVVLQQPQEEAVGDDLDAGARTDLGVAAARG